MLSELLQYEFTNVVAKQIVAKRTNYCQTNERFSAHKFVAELTAEWDVDVG